MNTTFVLGATDPEMEAIEDLLSRCGQSIVYAYKNGRRVSPAEAYSADGTSIPLVCADYGQTVTVCVETEIRWLHGCYGNHHTIDHHRPGDPGFGRQPAKFLPVSSLGQVIAWLARSGDLLGLGWPSVDGGDGCGYNSPTGEFQFDSARWLVHSFAGSHDPALGKPLPQSWSIVPQNLVLFAAADHCLGAAYRGACPGVDPDALMSWRAESRAKFQKRSVEDILRDVETTTGALLAAPQIEVDQWTPVWVRDMRREPPYPELPEAATRLGAAYISGPLVNRDGRRKFTGSGTETEVRAIMAWMKDKGLVGIYGDPARGFCGGYVP